MHIGKAIRQVRRTVGMNQRQLSEATGISSATLSQIESGRKRPGPSSMRKICEGLEIPEVVLYVIGMDEEDVPKSRQNSYRVVYPAIRKLVLQLVESTHHSLVRKNPDGS